MSRNWRDMIDGIDWEQCPWPILWHPLSADIPHHPSFVGLGKGKKAWVVSCPKAGTWIQAYRKGGETWCATCDEPVTWLRKTFGVDRPK